MISATAPRAHPGGWQREWREAVTDPAELLELLGLASLAPALPPEGPVGFALRVPRAFVARMRRGDAHDPLLRQVLPLAAENDAVEGYGIDAVGDLDARRAAGVIHKYEGRALLVATGACAVHCRYCFRRHFPYAEETATRESWSGALAWIDAHREVDELILSGGDPLSLATHKLADLTHALRERPWIKRLRIHTRLPVVLPSRVDDELTGWLAGCTPRTVVVLHANHANEIDAAVAAAATRLREAGATLLNQSVLLRGVNDDPGALAALSDALFACGVLPYYLHQLDRVAGAAHFAVDDARARELVAELRGRLSGYLVPRLVREIAGEPAKTPL
jgi:EF-P beta-lysylation protein EpmB